MTVLDLMNQLKGCNPEAMVYRMDGEECPKAVRKVIEITGLDVESVLDRGPDDQSVLLS